MICTVFHKGEKTPLYLEDGPRVCLGRTPQSFVAISDSTVSRAPVYLMLSNQGVYIESHEGRVRIRDTFFLGSATYIKVRQEYRRSFLLSLLILFSLAMLFFFDPEEERVHTFVPRNPSVLRIEALLENQLVNADDVHARYPGQKAAICRWQETQNLSSEQCWSQLDSLLRKRFGEYLRSSAIGFSASSFEILQNIRNEDPTGRTPTGKRAWQEVEL